jgi:hypothetical protein
MGEEKDEEHVSFNGKAILLPSNNLGMRKFNKATINE